MKLLVLSDIHGRVDRARDVMALHADADALLFLGDGIRSLPYEEWMGQGKLFAGVRGNCDSFLFGSDYEFSNELLLNFDAYTVMMMHGHTHGVKGGIERALAYAYGRGANLLLYGHTHRAEERYFPEGTKIGDLTLHHPMWVMNPGSLGEPREGNPSYGLVQIRNGQILLSHGDAPYFSFAKEK